MYLDNFDNLFQGLNPKAIVLYLGGNDLSLGLSAKEIIYQIRDFILIIHKKFPKTRILNISIKPSYEREKQLGVIKDINQGILDLSSNLDYLHQIKLHETLIDDNKKIRGDVLLQDGLHLNTIGYEILKSHVNKALKKYL